MTTTSELEAMVNKLQLKTPFRGVMMKDELKNIKPKITECGIINLNSSDVPTEENKKTGHWIAYFRKNKNNYHFCSYGSPPPQSLIEYLSLSGSSADSPVHTHTFAIQEFGESICGELAVLFLYLMDKNLDSGTTQAYFDTVLTILKMRQYEKR